MSDTSRLNAHSAALSVVPLRISNRLDNDAELKSRVIQSIHQLAPWLGDATTGLTFFPEYTDHGLRHIGNVLAAADALITDEAYRIVTAADCATLILSTFLHDAAMHLTKEGFAELFRRDAPNELANAFNDRSWSELWTNYFLEASRWNSKSLHSVIGVSPERSAPTQINAPPVFESRQRPWNDVDLRLVGEFIRRHHPRIAHEMAVFGIPGSVTDERTRIRLAMEPNICDLVGLVARSHGMPLRGVIPYLEQKYGMRQVQEGVHSIYLMVLLRIADYLEIDADRAPSALQSLRQLRSPLSRREWKAHHAVRVKARQHPDPEAIYVYAVPERAQEFIRCKGLLAAIQQELDTSWGVLGEVYHSMRKVEWQELGINLRRVRSNLDDVARFKRNENIAYHPVEAKLTTATAELVKLLITPLYGESPEVGVREIMQNSIDAVLERQSSRDGRESDAEEDIEAASEIYLDLRKDVDGDYWLSVEDHGVGMTVETITDFYLRSGASIRQDPKWRARYWDSNGHCRIMRSGRFGIGALAAFLLGDTVMVSTRHLSLPASEGVYFQCHVDDDAIELKRITRPAGTTVSVRLTKETAALLRQRHRSTGRELWDWYALAAPKIIRRVGRNGKALKQHYSLNEPCAELPPAWSRVKHSDYEDIQWSYFEGPSLCCNGIIVEDFDDLPGPMWTDSSKGYVLQAPNVSVFDPSGHLPLDLTRSCMTTDEFPFCRELVKSVCEDFVAYCLVFAPERIPSPNDNGIANYLNAHPALCMGTPDQYWTGVGHGWIYNKDGAAFPDRHLFLGMKVSRALIFHGSAPDVWLRDLAIPDDLGLLPISQGVDINWRYSVPESPVGGYRFPELFHVSSRRFVDSSSWDPESYERDKSFFASRVWSQDGLDLWEIGDCPKSRIDFERAARAIGRLPPARRESAWGTEVYISERQPRRKISPIAKAWRRLIKQPIIPYDPGERRRQLAHAYLALRPRVEFWNSYRSKMQESGSGEPRLNFTF